MRPTLSPRLEPPELERRFREDSLPRDMRMARTLTFGAIAFHAISMPLDVSLVGEDGPLAVVWGVRGVSVAIAALVFILLESVRTVKAFDRAVFWWYFSLLAGLLVANAYLPTDYITHIAWDVLLTLAAYTVLPLPMGRQILLGGWMTVGSLALFLWGKDLDPPVILSDVLLVFVCANLVGTFASREIHAARRRNYEALRTETQAAQELRVALSEIRTLRGVIPICASCKQVRTDQGVWRQVEAYVRDHSLAEFSHGICPTCAKTYYDELSEGG